MDSDSVSILKTLRSFSEGALSLSPATASTKEFSSQLEDSSPVSARRKTRRSFSLSKLLAPKEARTVERETEKRAEVPEASKAPKVSEESPLEPNQKSSLPDSETAHHGFSRWFKNLGTLFGGKRRMNAADDDQLTSASLSDLGDSATEMELSCYHSFKNIDIQASLNSLRDSMDPVLLRKTTQRIYYPKEGKRSLEEQFYNGTSLNVEDAVNEESENESEDSPKQGSQDENAQNLGPPSLETYVKYNKEDNNNSQALAPITNIIDYGLEKKVSANCAPDIYLNSEITKMFDHIKTKSLSEYSKFYISPSEEPAHLFPDLEIQSPISIGNDFSGSSIGEEFEEGLMSSFVEDLNRGAEVDEEDDIYVVDDEEEEDEEEEDDEEEESEEEDDEDAEIGYEAGEEDEDDEDEEEDEDDYDGYAGDSISDKMASNEGVLSSMGELSELSEKMSSQDTNVRLESTACTTMYSPEQNQLNMKFHGQEAGYLQHEEQGEKSVKEEEQQEEEENEIKETVSPTSGLSSEETEVVVEKTTDVLSPISVLVSTFNKASDKALVSRINSQCEEDKNGSRRSRRSVGKGEQNDTSVLSLNDGAEGTSESMTLKFHAKAKVLIYDHESDCKSIRKVFNSENKTGSSPLKWINKSISKRLSGFSSSSSSSQKAATPVVAKSDRSILKNKVNLNQEQESIRANNCDEVEVEDFLCFFETHERRRMDTEPFLEHFREKQIESYYQQLNSLR